VAADPSTVNRTGDAELLARYAPAVCYDSQEAFFADDAAQMAVNPGNRLLREPKAGQPPEIIAAATPSDGQERLTLEFIGAKTYNDAAKTPVAKTDRLGIVGRNYREQYSALRTANPDLRNRVYGRAARDGEGALWLQYWLFYIYNDYQLAFDIGLHEGDWEMIQLRLDGEVPECAVYAQHTYAEVRSWDRVERLPGSTDTPLVFPGRGSHASYFNAGSYSTEVWFDIADGERGPNRLDLTIIDDSTEWVRWPGRWGDTDAGSSKIDQPSPRGPRQHKQWRDPSVLLATAKMREPPKAVTPAEPPEIGVEVGNGKLEVRYDLRRRAPVPPLKLNVTINSRDEKDVAPRTVTCEVDTDHGLLRTDIAIDPKLHYDVRVSSLDATQRPSASALRFIAPEISGGPLVRFREWLGELVRRLTRRGKAPPGP
jgi:hypothetical protein